MLVHIGTIMQKYLHNIYKAAHTRVEQWCVAVLDSRNENTPKFYINFFSYLI